MLRRCAPYVALLFGCGEPTAAEESGGGSSGALGSSESTQAGAEAGSTDPSSTGGATSPTSGSSTGSDACADTPWNSAPTAPWVVSAHADGDPFALAVLPRTSRDGRFVVFASVTTIGPDPGGPTPHALLADNDCGVIEDIVLEGPGNIAEFEISADGSRVAFARPGPEADQAELFAYDTQSKTLERIDVDPSGEPAYGFSRYLSLSDDGRYVAFGSDAEDLTADDGDPVFDVFVRDLQAGTTELVSVDTDGTKGNGDSDWPSISGDGRLVAFYSRSPNFSLATIGSAGAHVYLKDRTSGELERISPQSEDMNAARGTGIFPEISSDGRFVAFEIETALLPEDTDEAFDVYLFDRQLRTLELVSVDGPPDMPEHAASGRLSDDGQQVVFGAGPTWQSLERIFVRDRGTQTTRELVLATDGSPADAPVYTPDISGDGRWMVFSTRATNVSDPALPTGVSNTVMMAPL